MSCRHQQNFLLKWDCLNCMPLQQHPGFSLSFFLFCFFFKHNIILLWKYLGIFGRFFRPDRFGRISPRKIVLLNHWTNRIPCQRPKVPEAALQSSLGQRTHLLQQSATDSAATKVGGGRQTCLFNPEPTFTLTRGCPTLAVDLGRRTPERERALLVAVSHRATGRCDDTPTGQCHVQGRGMKAQLSCLIHYRRLFLLDFSVSFFKDHENPILEMPNWVFLEFI